MNEDDDMTFMQAVRAKKLEEELKQDGDLEETLKGDTFGRIDLMTRDDVEAMCSTPEGLQSVLMQLFAGLLEGLHPLRQGEIIINDQDIQAALAKKVNIEREDGFFHVKLQD
jgi:hypothetical protein